MDAPAPISGSLLDSQNSRTGAPPLSLSMKRKKKMQQSDARLWMCFHAAGGCELLELDRNTITKLFSIPGRDLRILGPMFSHSSSILAREKALVFNLEFIKAIVTAQEVLILDPTNPAVLPFIDQLRHQLGHQNRMKEKATAQIMTQIKDLPILHHTEQLLRPDFSEGSNSELPFEFRVLELALEVICDFLDTKVVELERIAYPVLDKLTRNICTSNLEHVRSLKSDLTRLLSRVQKVRDEMEHLLDDHEDMAQMYLTRKLLFTKQGESNPNASSLAISSGVAGTGCRHSRRTSFNMDGHNVDELEMLLEAYFMQVDGTRNKLLTVREYFDDTEDYINIQLDNQRNEIIQLRLCLIIFSFTISLLSGFAGMLSVNFRCLPLYHVEGLLVPLICIFITVATTLFFLILGYAHSKGLFTT